MTILLMGLIGSGKTTLGKKLATDLKYKFIELDQLALEYSGLSSDKAKLPQSQQTLSTAMLHACKDLSREKNIVVACGGTFLENRQNVDAFEGQNILRVYLTASTDILAQRAASRITSDHKKLHKSIDALHTQRKQSYLENSDLVIDTHQNDIDKCIELIKKLTVL